MMKLINGKEYFEGHLLELVILAESGQVDSAIALLEKLESNVLEVSVGSREWFLRSIAAQRGEVYASAQQFELALVSYSKAQTQVHEEYPQNQQAMANIYALTNRYSQSVKAIEEGLRAAEIIGSSYALELLVAYVEYGSKIGLVPALKYANVLFKACRLRHIAVSNSLPKTSEEFITEIKEAWRRYIVNNARNSELS